MNAGKTVGRVVLAAAMIFLSWADCRAVYYSWTELADFKGIQQYNLFLKGDLRYYRSDVEGRVAVGGNARMKGFSIGVKSDKARYSLVVGGRLNAGGMADDAGGQVNNGGIYSGGKTLLQRVGLPQGDVVSGSDLTLRHMTVENGSVEAGGDIRLVNADVSDDAVASGRVTLKNSTVHGETRQNQPVDPDPPVEFEDIDLEAISETILANRAATAILDGGQLLLECTDPLVCYFNVSEKQIEDAWGVKINASAGKTVVINVKNRRRAGRRLRLADMAFELFGGIRSTNVLYNFYGFEDIVMRHLGLKGSILAPGATVNFSQGHMEGVLMTLNLHGGSWKGGTPGGQINMPAAVPEPATCVLLLTALSVLAVSSGLFGKKS